MFSYALRLCLDTTIWEGGVAFMDSAAAWSLIVWAHGWYPAVDGNRGCGRLISGDMAESGE